MAGRDVLRESVWIHVDRRPYWIAVDTRLLDRRRSLFRRARVRAVVGHVTGLCRRHLAVDQ